MNQSQIIRDALGALRPANTFSVPTYNPHSTKVLILRAARIAGIKVKTWHIDGMVFIVRVE